MSDSASGWGVDSGPGLTALGLAASRLVESSRDDRLVDDPWGRRFLDAVDSPVPFPTRWPAADEPVGDQQALHLHGSRYIGLRTRVYDDWLLDACAAGIGQVVLLAAGLDTRALRLPWPAGVRVHELDQPQVLDFKGDVLGRDGSDRPERVPVGVDLRTDWSGPLLASGFDETRPAAWVAEGLLAYLSPDAERMLLERVSTLSAPGSRFAADRLLPAAASDVARLTSSSGLDMQTMLDTTRRASPAEALTSLGWRTHEVGVDELASRHGRDLSDPFARSGASAQPWLATSFVFGER